MIDIIDGDLLDANTKYIAHACNCITTVSASLAKNLFNKYSYADIYINRLKPDVPGTIKVCGNGQDKRYIINLLSQYYPGKTKFPNSSLDGIKAREKYFHQCLIKVSKISNLESIAMPVGIGCGLAGGDWNYYLGIIINFSKYIYKKQKAYVKLYKL